MKKLFTFMAVILVAATNIDANVITWNSGYRSLEDAKFYAWNIYSPLSPGEVVTEATFTYHNLLDIDYSSQDRLFTHLMDDKVETIFGVAGTDENARDGFWVGWWRWRHYVSPVPADDAWDGYGPLLGVHIPQRGVAETFSYNLGDLGLLDELNAFLRNDGWISFGIDPDCHYTPPNSCFSLTTTFIPAPGAILLGGIGVGLVGWLRRRRTL